MFPKKIQKTGPDWGVHRSADRGILLIIWTIRWFSLTSPLTMSGMDSELEGLEPIECQCSALTLIFSIDVYLFAQHMHYR